MPVINKDFRVAGTDYTFNDLCPKVLYSSTTGTTEDVNIGDYASNYDYFDITWNVTDSSNQYFHLDQIITTRVYSTSQMMISGVVGHPGWNQTGYVMAGLVADGTYIKKNGSAPCTVISFGYYDTNPTWYNKTNTPVLHIYKVVGYQTRNNYNEIDRTYHQ